MRQTSLVTRLNLWYGGVLLFAIALLLVSAELGASYLAAHRRVALVEHVASEVRQSYQTGGSDEAAQLEIPGIPTRLTDSEGHPLGPPRRPGTVEVQTRIDRDVWLHTSVPDAVVRETRRDARLALLGGGLLALLLASLGGQWVTRRALRPIGEVAETASQIVHHGDTGRRVPSPHTGDLLERLVASFNALLDANQRMVQSMRHSLDSVGHDVRTPLTRIQSAAELGLQSGSLAEKDEALETCLEESQDTVRLLASLLDLTRAEAGMLALQPTPCVSSELLGRVVSLYEHVAAERQIDLKVAPHPVVTLRVDPMRAQQALANLVDNALKFTPPGGQVLLSAVVEGEAHGLSVHDTGPGIPARERPHVFERLYRADLSRGTPGAGLGLAMVKAIVEAHGGHVTLHAPEGEGTTITLWLP